MRHFPYSNPCLWVVTTLRHWKWGGSTSNTIGSLLYALKIFGKNRQTSRWKREKVQVRWCGKGSVTSKDHIISFMYSFVPNEHQISNADVFYLRCSRSHLWARFCIHFLFSIYVYVGLILKDSVGSCEILCGFGGDEYFMKKSCCHPVTRSCFS